MPGTAAPQTPQKTMNSSQNFGPALTNARMALRAFNGGGPLGEGALLGADRGGGYTVEQKSYPTLPIVEVLGLEVDRWRRDGNVDVASIRPVAPLWYNADLDYNTGHNLAWRTDDTRWRDEWGRTYPPRAEEKRRDERGRATPAHVEPPRYEDRLFNTTLGVSASPAAGEFLYKGLTLRVLPLELRHLRDQLAMLFSPSLPLQLKL